MTTRKRETAERYVEELEASLDSLKGYGKEVDEFDLATEMLLLLRGSRDDVLAFWNKAPQAYLSHEVGDYARRDVVTRYDRADLLEAMDRVCWACWSVEDVLKIPLGPSKLRKHLVTKSRDRLVPNSDSALVSGDDVEVHRLALAVACADVEAVTAVEQADWLVAESTPESWAQARMSGAVACLKRRSDYDNIGRRELLKFASAQWHQALSEGANPNQTSFDVRVLTGHAHDGTHTPLETLVDFARSISSFSAISESDLQALDVVRDMIWSEGGAAAQKGWCFVLETNKTAREVPAKSGWPILLDGDEALDPFLEVLNSGYTFGVIEAVARQAEVTPELVLGDARMKQWVDAVADLATQPAPQYGWTHTCDALATWLNLPDGAPLAWMNPEQQQRWHCFRENMAPALERMLTVWKDGQEEIKNNRCTRAAFLESPAWREVVLDAHLVRQWGDIKRPTAGPRPRF